MATKLDLLEKKFEEENKSFLVLQERIEEIDTCIYFFFEYFGFGKTNPLFPVIKKAILESKIELDFHFFYKKKKERQSMIKNNYLIIKDRYFSEKGGKEWVIKMMKDKTEGSFSKNFAFKKESLEILRFLSDLLILLHSFLLQKHHKEKNLFVDFFISK